MGFEQYSIKAKDHYEDITRADMIALGASYELIGRFSCIINYHTLSDAMIDKIIDQLARRTGDAIGCRLVISKAMRECLHENANSKYGCRILDSLIRESAMNGYLHMQKAGIDRSSHYIRLTGPGTAKCVKTRAEEAAPQP